MIKDATFITDGIQIVVRIAWALIKEVPLPLGRMDAFNKFKITFDEEKESIIFNPSPQI